MLVNGFTKTLPASAFKKYQKEWSLIEAGE